MNCSLNTKKAKSAPKSEEVEKITPVRSDPISLKPNMKKRVDNAEQAIKAITGVKQIRVRDHNGLARIEVGKAERALFCRVDVLDRVAEDLKKLGFKYVTVDLEGYRSGSMLKTLDT